MSLIIQSILLNVILCSLWQYGCSVSWDCSTSYQYRHANLWLTHTRRMHLHICRLIQRTYYTSTLTNYNWHQDYILWGDLTHSVACLTFDIRNLKTENEVFSVCTIWTAVLCTITIGCRSCRRFRPQPLVTSFCRTPTTYGRAFQYSLKPSTRSEMLRVQSPSNIERTYQVQGTKA